MPTHESGFEQTSTRTATTWIVALVVAMLAVAGLVFLVRSGPTASDQAARTVGADTPAAAAATAPPLTEPIVAPPTTSATTTATQPAASNTLAATPPPTTAPIMVATIAPVAPTLAAIAPTSTSTTTTESATNGTPAQTAAADTATAKSLAAALPTVTLTPVPTATTAVAAEPTATSTVVPTPIPQPTATATPVPLPSSTPTVAPEPTATATPVPPSPTAVPAQTDLNIAQLEARMLADVNRVRAGVGLAPLAPSSGLDSIGRDWSRNMAAAGGISHRPASQLSAMMPAGWTAWAENVAQAPYGPRLQTIAGDRLETIDDAALLAQRELVQSPGHYTNMVGDYNTLGIGIHVQDGWVWVTQNFGKY